MNSGQKDQEDQVHEHIIEGAEIEGEILSDGEDFPIDDMDDDGYEDENEEGEFDQGEFDQGEFDQGEGQEQQQPFIFEDDSVQGFFKHKDSVYTVAINPKDDNIVASGGGDDLAYVWGRDSGEIIFELQKHSDSVISVGFSSDGEYLATGSMDGTINVYKSGLNTIYHTFDGPDEIVWMNWHPIGNVLLAGANDSSIWMFNVASKTCMNVFYGHSAPVTCGQFTNSGKNIVSGAEDGALHIWSPTSASIVQKFTPADKRFHQDAVTCIALSADDSLILSGSVDTTAKISHKNGTILGSLENHTDSVEAVGISDVMNFGATGSVDGTISIWDINTLRLRNTFQHDDAVTKLKWHKNSPLLTSISSDCTARVWDSRSGDCVRVWKGHQDAVLDFALTSDGSSIVTASDDSCCLVFA